MCEPPSKDPDENSENRGVVATVGAGSNPFQLLEGSFQLIYRDTPAEQGPPPGDCEYRKAKGLRRLPTKMTIQMKEAVQLAASSILALRPAVVACPFNRA